MGVYWGAAMRDRPTTSWWALKPLLRQSARRLPRPCGRLGWRNVGVRSHSWRWREPQTASLQRWYRRYEAYFRLANVQVDGDIMAAFTGAFPLGNGLVMIAGTGSVAFGLAAGGERVQVGGWGYLLGDEGSGYAIGLDALRTVLRFYDGREAATTLAPALLDHLALSSPAALVRRVYTDRMNRDEIAAIAPFVAAHAAAGDTASVRILWNAGGALADLACAGVERIIQSGIGANVALLGGLFAHIPMLTDAFQRHLRACLPDTMIVAPRFDAVGGAAILALREAGVALTEPVLARLAESL